MYICHVYYTWNLCMSCICPHLVHLCSRQGFLYTCIHSQELCAACSKLPGFNTTSSGQKTTRPLPSREARLKRREARLLPGDASASFLAHSCIPWFTRQPKKSCTRKHAGECMWCCWSCVESARKRALCFFMSVAGGLRAKGWTWQKSSCFP